MTSSGRMPHASGQGAYSADSMQNVSEGKDPVAGRQRSNVSALTTELKPWKVFQALYLSAPLTSRLKEHFERRAVRRFPAAIPVAKQAFQNGPENQAIGDGCCGTVHARSGFLPRFCNALIAQPLTRESAAKDG